MDAQVQPVRGSAFQPLQKTRQLGGWMQTNEDVQVRRHDAELQKPAALLPHDDWQVLMKVGRPGPIDRCRAVAGRPHDVH